MSTYSESETLCFKNEKNSLKENNWHLACLKTELSSNFQYCALTVASVPILIWNMNGKLRAFKNVCLHRHSKIIADGFGKSETLRCQYHGWEYSPYGKLKHVPDIEQFPTMMLPIYCLSEFSIEIIGDFVLIALNSGISSFKNALLTSSDNFDPFFSSDSFYYKQTLSLNLNWRVLIKKILLTHPDPLSPDPDIAHQQSKSDKLKSTFSSTQHYNFQNSKKLQYSKCPYLLLLLPLLKSKDEFTFTITHVFPHFLFYQSKTFSVCFYFEPLSAIQTKMIVYCYKKQRPNRMIFHNLIRFITRSFILYRIQSTLAQTRIELEQLTHLDTPG